MTWPSTWTASCALVDVDVDGDVNVNGLSPLSDSTSASPEKEEGPRTIGARAFVRVASASAQRGVRRKPLPVITASAVLNEICCPSVPSGDSMPMVALSPVWRLPVLLFVIEQ